MYTINNNGPGWTAILHAIMLTKVHKTSIRIIHKIISSSSNYKSSPDKLTVPTALLAFPRYRPVNVYLVINKQNMQTDFLYMCIYFGPMRKGLKIKYVLDP